MNALTTGLKTLTCGLTAVAITTVMSWSLVQSTSVVPFGASPTPVQMAKLTTRHHHVLFGQSLPAVLVD
ncbi:MAG TPA: hypothetical protein VMT29_20655 [Steroidobacteraceae bacterium]|nr:hypothetical protein [Steroidobacteraceae bacterium]